MAKGDFVLFAKTKEDLGNAVHNLSANTIKLALIRSAANGGIDPTELTTDPRWGVGGGVDLSASEVVPGGNYVAGGVTLVNVSWTLTGNTVSLNANDINIPIDAANPTNARWAIIYNDTAAGKQAIGYIDLGADMDLTTDDFDYIVHANGFFQAA